MSCNCLFSVLSPHVDLFPLKEWVRQVSLKVFFPKGKTVKEKNLTTAFHLLPVRKLLLTRAFCFFYWEHFVKNLS